jgi:GT2 family glycosyltransferase
VAPNFIQWGSRISLSDFIDGRDALFVSVCATARRTTGAGAIKVPSGRPMQPLAEIPVGETGRQSDPAAIFKSGLRRVDVIFPKYPPSFTGGWVGVHVSSAKPKAECALVIKVTGEKKVPTSLRVSLQGPHDGKLRNIVKIPNEILTIHIEGDGVTSSYVEPMRKEQIAQRLANAKLKNWLTHPTKAWDSLREAWPLCRPRKLRELKSWFKEQLFDCEIKVKTPYSIWFENYQSLSEKDRIRITSEISVFSYSPKISVVMPVFNTDERWLKKSIDSVRAQYYANWELCIADDCSSRPHVKQMLEDYSRVDARIKVVYRKSNGHIAAASNSALEKAAGEFIALLDHDDELTPDAFYEVVKILQTRPRANLIFSDEDKIDAFGRRFDPHFKPDWNLDLFYSLNVITHLCVMRSSIVKKIGGFRTSYVGAQDYDLFLRVVEQTTPAEIVHIPRVLYHWRTIPGSTAIGPEGKSYAVVNARKAIADHFKRTQTRADVVAGEQSFHRVVYRLPNKLPLVTAIICTRDRANLLKVAVRGFLEETKYAKRELIVIDNDSTDSETLRYLNSLRNDRRVRVIPFKGNFNFSAMNNVAVRHALGEVIAFLNNDLEVIEPLWLTEMVRFALQPAIGAVGARLLFPNDEIQHAGIVLGMGGVAGHPHKGYQRHEMGYVGRAKVIQGFSGVTAACMVLRKEVFEKVGGFDEVYLPVAFNDVDLCLRIADAGYRIVWTPYAELYHHESASRGSDETPERRDKFLIENKVMEDRWGHRLERDPFYSANLSLNRGDFNLALPPRH